MAIRILLADYHKISAQGFAALLGDEPDLEVVGIALTSRQAVEFAKVLLPDVVVMDVVMPDLSGMDATREILFQCPDVKVLALSAHGEQGYVEGMMRSGALGYLLKYCGPDDLAEAIRTVHSGRPYLGRGVRTAEQAGRRPSSGGTRAAARVLSNREREVLRLVADGMDNMEIASLLRLSHHTVARHRQNVMDKLDIHSTAQLTHFAVKEHIATP